MKVTGTKQYKNIEIVKCQEIDGNMIFTTVVGYYDLHVGKTKNSVYYVALREAEEKCFNFNSRKCGPIAQMCHGTGSCPHLGK